MMQPNYQQFWGLAQNHDRRLSTFGLNQELGWAIGWIARLHHRKGERDEATHCRENDERPAKVRGGTMVTGRCMVVLIALWASVYAAAALAAAVAMFKRESVLFRT